ncbi:MAG: 5-formyltetrahydrofolate cyclo-ligase [Kiritimatiellales bacterium]|nr:5-formyltetrahydrofolate cyclo-ligase [Kiritimatiellales bacterium]
MSILEQKDQIRKEIDKKIKNTSLENRTAESHAIANILLNLIPKHSTVCAYSALPSEVDLTELITILISSKHHVALPRYEKDTITFYKIENLDTLTKGAFSVLEPDTNSTVVDRSDIDIVLVPGRAFDSKGNRLGRGKGGYDKWIAEQRSINPETKMWGIAFECQIVDEVPMEKHDERLDSIISCSTSP